MRALLALTMLLLGLNAATPEPEYSSLIRDYFHALAGSALPALVEIESSTGRADRLSLADLRALKASDRSLAAAAVEPPPSPDLMSADIDFERAPEVSLHDLCNALLTSAQDNDLPVPFFANLIWQESRLRDDAVSPVGALGIAQFMPQVAVESGLDNPFDPLQAIPASARLLRALRAHFRNLGFAAAAYNAGAHRVSAWLEHRRALPRETRDYVVRVTGRTAEDWRKTPIEAAALTFVRRLPCRDLPAFADLEQAQAEQALWQDAQSPKAERAPSHPVQQSASPARGAHAHTAERKRLRTHIRRDASRTAARHRNNAERRAERPRRGPRDKRKSA